MTVKETQEQKGGGRSVILHLILAATTIQNQKRTYALKEFLKW